jgi:hypothetical protein
MKVGVTLPLSDIGGGPATVRLFAEAAEAAGYDHLAAPDHVLGVNVASWPGWGARNTSADLFHDIYEHLWLCARGGLVRRSWPVRCPTVCSLQL